MEPAETIRDDWFALAQSYVEGLHWSLYQAKADASDDEKYQRELKYVLRGFGHADSLFRELPPNPDETHVAYLERIVPVVAEVPNDVADIDREWWTDGIRQFVRVISYGTTFRYPPLEVVPKAREPLVAERTGLLLRWYRFRCSVAELRDRVERFFSF